MTENENQGIQSNGTDVQAEVSSSSDAAVKARTRVQLNKTLPDSRLMKFDQHLEALKAYVKAYQTYKRPLRYTDFQGLVSYNTQMVSGLNKFFEELGLVVGEKGQPGCYSPTEKLKEFVNALTWDENQAKTILASVVTTSWFWQDAKLLLETKGVVSEDDLLKRFGFTAGAQPQHKPALKCLLGYITYSELVKLGGQGYLLTSATTTPEQMQDMKSPGNPIPMDDPPKEGTENIVEKKSVGTVQLSHRCKMQVSLEIKVDSAMPTEKLREILQVIKEVLNE